MTELICLDRLAFNLQTYRTRLAGAAAAASPQSLEIVLLVDQTNSTYKQDL
jgi:hypothetical protein